jgi:hypothetical protein
MERHDVMRVSATVFIAFLGFGGGATLAQEPPRLGLPIACDREVGCIIQNHVDRDPSPGTRDYACGAATYDGHDGTDFRVPTMADVARGVDVIAVLDGTVRGWRDGMDDVGLAGKKPGELAGRECGNGVVLVHPDGYETQYCHLKKGSVVARTGQVVKAGDRLGQVGLSGQTEFPHVHLSVRRNGKSIDPFAPDPAAACGVARDALWTREAADKAGYRLPAVLNWGFNAGPVTQADVESGRLLDWRAERAMPALVAYARVVGLAAGDVQSIEIRDPSGGVFVTQTLDPTDRSKAQFLLFAGKKKPASGWTAGRYTATITVRRAGNTIAERRFDVVMEP